MKRVLVFLIILATLFLLFALTPALCNSAFYTISYDGNGKHDNGSNTFAFTVDDKKILITMADGSEMEIPYTLEGDSIKLEKDKYFTIEEIDEGIQGYWNVRSTFRDLLGKNSSSEHTIYFNDGKVISESATGATGGAPGEYNYFGPETGSYTLNFGGINTECVTVTIGFST